MILFHFELL